MRKKVNCSLCGGEVSKTARGLCLKLLGKKEKRLFCLDCLANHLDVSTDDLLQKAEDFRREGCKMFM